MQQRLFSLRRALPLVLGLFLWQQPVDARVTGGPQQSRTTSNCTTTNPEKEEDVGFYLPERVAINVLDLVKMIQVTLADYPLEEPNPGGFNTWNAFEDRNDCAIVARKGRNCLVVFEATNFDNILDVIQLYAWDTDTIRGCTFRGGIWSAYLSTYYDDFVTAVDRCMATSPRQQLILGGHSQGGAISVVASADFKRYNPTVVTIGSVRSLVKPCSDIVPENHYRFVHALEGGYDYWPMEFDSQGMHVGHTIYLDSNADNLASYVGLNDDTNREPNDVFDFNNHNPDNYFKSLSKLIDSPMTAVSSSSSSECNSDTSKDNGFRITGWESGHFCHAADECIGHSCLDHTCSSGWPKQ